MDKKPKPVPTFASETEEREYWETHDSTKHLDWTEARRALLPKLEPSPDSSGLAVTPTGGT